MAVNVYEQEIPGCVTLKLLPAIVAVPEFVLMEEFALAMTVTEPEPEPESGVTEKNEPADAVQLCGEQFEGDGVMLTTELPPD